MTDKNIPDLILERYLLKELPERLIKELDERAKSDDTIRQRLENLRKSNGEIELKYSSRDIAEQINRRYDEVKRQDTAGHYRKARRWLIYPSFAAAAAVIFIFIFPGINNIRIPDPQDVTRVKGMRTDLYVYRKKNNSAELLKNGSIAKKGDLLQIAFSSTENPYAVILSIDGRKTVTLHFPKSHDSSTEIDLNKKILLSESYQLDDAPRYERFFLLTSKKKPDVDKILRAAKEFARDTERSVTGMLPLEDYIKQFSLIINKGEKP